MHDHRGFVGLEPGCFNDCRRRPMQQLIAQGRRQRLSQSQQAAQIVQALDLPCRGIGKPFLDRRAKGLADLSLDGA